MAFSPPSVRMKQFESRIPRVEVNAIWCILGFLAASDARTSAPTSKNRWQLVYTILCCETGVLPKALDDFSRSSPSPNHLARLEIELGYLTLLVGRGAMMPLEGTDKIIGTLLKRLILLQSKSVLKDMYLYRLHDVSFSKEQVLAQWEDSSFNLKSADALPNSAVGNKNFLLPGLLQNGVDLLASWIRQVRKKPVLLTQLASSISKLQELEKVYPTSKNGKDTFAAVFEQNEQQCALFLREAAVAFMTAFDIVRSECAMAEKKPFITLTALSRYWSLLSDSQMKLRHDELCGKITHCQAADSEASCSTLYFSAIRTYSIFLLAHFGETVVLVDGGPDTIAQLDGNGRSTRETHQYLLHDAFCYIVVSLDCLCTSILAMRNRHSCAESAVKALSLSLTWISQIAVVCRKLHGRSSHAFSRQQRTELLIVGASIFKLFTDTLIKCMYAALTLSKYEGSDSCFCLCITAIRNIVAWAVVVRADNWHARENDEFEGEDNSVFDYMETCSDEAEPAADRLSQKIVNLLNIADPSNVYRVDRNVSFEHAVAAHDPHERSLLSRFAGGLCACLASLVAAGSKCKVMPTIVRSALGRSDIDTFKRYLSFLILAEICKLAERSPECKEFLEEKVETFAAILLDMMLDADSLERFPTCDIEIMMKMVGNKGVQRERKRLNLMHGKCVTPGGLGIRNGENIDEIGPVYVCRNLWKCSQDFQKVVGVRASTRFLANHLESIDYETRTDCTDHNSLEMECLRRMEFCLSFFRVEAEAPIERVFEDTLMLAIKSTMLNLLKIGEGLMYHDLKRRKSITESLPSLTHSHCKLAVLQASYVEMFVGIVSFVVLANWYRFSASFRCSLSKLREALVFSMSNCLENDIEGCLRQFVGQPERSETSQRAGVPMLDLRRCVKLACLRRSREIVQRHLSLAPRSDRQRGAIALIVSASSFVNDATIPCEYILDVVAEGFRTNSDSPLLSSPGRPLFQDYVDEHIFNTKKESPAEGGIGETVLGNSTRSLRIFILSKVIPSRLRNRSQVNDRTKASLAGLANRLLYIESDDFGASNGMNAESAVGLHELLNSLWDVMCKSIEVGPTACALLASTLRCISLVMSLPIIGISDEPIQSLLRWSFVYTKHSIAGGGKLAGKTRLEMFACYVSTFAALAFHATSFLCQPNTLSSVRLGLILKQAEGDIQGILLVSAPSLDASDIVNLMSQLRGLDKAIDCKNNEMRNEPRNVYIKTANEIGSQNLPLLDQVSPEVRREASNLKAIIAGCNEIDE